MNYSLGRDVDSADRAHIARCKKCRRTLVRLERTALAEGLEMQGQASSMQPGAPRSRSAGDSETQSEQSASARYGW
jgi:hypothetical protein